MITKTCLVLTGIIILSLMIIALDNIFLFIILSICLYTLSLFKQSQRLFSRIKSLLLICLLIAFFDLLFYPSSDINIKINYALFASFRIMSLSMLVFYSLENIKTVELIKSLSFLPKQFVFALTLTLNLLNAVMDETGKISIIQKSRGLKSDAINPIKSIIPIIIPLLHRSLTRAEQLSKVMISRGYEHI
jgi:energy-coupling factor transporter transmembrane protein EcfT